MMYICWITLSLPCFFFLFCSFSLTDSHPEHGVVEKKENGERNQCRLALFYIKPASYGLISHSAHNNTGSYIITDTDRTIYIL